MHCLQEKSSFILLVLLHVLMNINSYFLFWDKNNAEQHSHVDFDGGKQKKKTAAFEKMHNLS